MEDNTHMGSAQQNSTEVPSLLNYISSNKLAGFDDINISSSTNDQCQTGEYESFSPTSNVRFLIILFLLKRNWHF